MTWTTRPRSDFGALAAIEAGEGPLILLLHGVGLRAEAWGAQIAPLADAGYRVIAPDMLGHGGSPLPADGAGLADYVAPLADSLDQPTLVVGHSMGTMMALALAARCPDHVRGVAALNAIYQRSDAAREAVLARASDLDGKSMADPTAPLTRWFGSDLTSARMACDAWLRDVAPAGYRAAYRVFAQEDGPSDALLSALTIPALFMTGAEEPNSTPAMSRAMAARAPNGRAVVVPDAAHMMPMTHAQEVTEAILALAQEAFA